VLLIFFRILVLFCNGAIERTSSAIERTVAGRSSAKSNSRAEDAVFSFLFCSPALSAIERTNLCDRALYQTATALVCESFILFFGFYFLLLF
jgi:hypothetical protein